jgi:outer membrane protein assembly factor BamA
MKKMICILMLSVTSLCAQHLYQGGGNDEIQREDIAKKTTGWRYTPIPLLNYTSDDGMGYGLRVGVYEYDGQTVPYKRAYKAQVFMTTEGKWAHLLSMDVPNFFPGQRVEIEAALDKQEFANYYGELTNRQVDSLHLTKNQRTFKNVSPNIEIKWIRGLRSAWQYRAGAGIKYTSIKPNARNGNILDTIRPVGFDGGVLFRINSSLRYDSRDNYLNSSKGIFDELLLEYKFGGGGDFSGWQLSYEHRHFIPLGESFVFGYRVAADQTFGNIPFYDELKLGGDNSVRGMPAARVRGQGRFLLNSELRWKGVRISDRRNMYLGFLAFGDAGQIFKRKDGPTLNPDQWHAGGGAGMRFYWHSTIIRIDYGYSEGGTGLYILFSQVF